MTIPLRIERVLTIATAAALLLSLTVGSSPGQSAEPAPTDRAAGRYIVTFEDEPAASYTGYDRRFAATQPARGRKLATNSAAVRAWRAHLERKHDAALARVGATKIYDYTVTNNAVAVELTSSQANELAKIRGVVGLSEDRMAQPDTTASPDFLGLTQAGGLWDQVAPGNRARAGAGLVVGVLDTGIWPENPSFRGGTGIPVPAGWNGRCMAGENFAARTCNDKLIGARYYTAGFGKQFIAREDYLSPRDGDGHGSHTASTAAGNAGVPVSIDGNALGTASGMAPGAKIAMYKVCWSATGGGGGCFNSDSVAAINDAVADGVDVINYSIGGGSESDVLDPVEQAFRGASNAGVYVAASAGNSGPGASTFDHPSPWLTTVAAATFRRAFQTLELGDGQRFVGASTTQPLPTAATIVTATSVKDAAATDDDAALCTPGTLDPAKATGKVVVCDRGVVDRIAKGFEVKRAGGVGLVLVNVSPNSLNGDYHPLPAVHVSDVDGTMIKAYVAALGAAATARIVPLSAAELASAPQVPEITDFSSRGPSTTTGGDILKPDVAAPGNDVVAAVAPPFHFGRSFNFLSGTSMAAPHIAGIAALLLAKHPTWLPSEVKSAIMTTTRDTVSSGDDPFAQGAGFVAPNAAADPGLVLPVNPNDYRRYMVGLGVQFAAPFDTLTPLAGPDLNQASIAAGAVPGSLTVTRTVKNVSGATSTYSSDVDLPGFDVVVTPAQFTLAPGATQQITVAFTRDGAPFDEYMTGDLTWTDGSGHVVRLPLALRAVGVAAPRELSEGASAAGSVSFEVTPGFSGPLTTSVSGLVGVTPTVDSVATSAFDPEAPATDEGTKLYQVEVAEATKVARFSLDAADDTADLDLWVYKDGELVDLSATAGADEEVTIVAPAAGAYDVYVNGFATPGGSTTYSLANFVVASASVGNATVSPNPADATQSVPLTLTASWLGLDVSKRYLGVIEYEGSSALTLLSVG